MITKKDAIVAGCKKEQDNNYNEQFGYQFESYKAHVTV